MLFVAPPSTVWFPVDSPLQSRHYPTSPSSAALVERSGHDLSFDMTKSLRDSYFLQWEVMFRALTTQLDGVDRVYQRWATDGEEVPNVVSKETARTVLQRLRKWNLTPDRVIPSAESGVAITFIGVDQQRAFIECLNAGDQDVVLYDLHGDTKTLSVEQENDWSRILEELKAHLEGKTFATPAS